MNNGVLCFANNNGRIDYVKQAEFLATPAQEISCLPNIWLFPHLKMYTIKNCSITLQKYRIKIKTQNDITTAQSMRAYFLKIMIDVTVMSLVLIIKPSIGYRCNNL